MLFEELARSATERLLHKEFYLLDEGMVERHGAWEWTWVKRREGAGHCYASLGVVGVEPDQYNLEIWTGADNLVRFRRFVVREFLGVRDDDLSEPAQNQVLEALEDAANTALALSDSDLTDSYIKPVPVESDIVDD